MNSSGKYSFERYRLQPGQVLFENEDPSDSFYVLSRGKLKLQRRGSTIIHLSEKDHPLGTPGFVERLPRQYAAVATEESVLKEFNLQPEGFFDWLDDHPLKFDGVVHNYANLVDHFNEVNDRAFDIFRDYRSVTDSFIRPFAQLTSRLTRSGAEIQSPPESLEQRLAENPFAALLRSYRRIVDATGRTSNTDLSDDGVPETSVEQYETGETICAEGETGDNLYVLINGSLSVLKGDQRLSTIDERGTVFGEMSPALNNRRHATVKADTSSKVSVISYDRLRYVLEESPDFSHKLLKMFYKRYRRAVNLNRHLTEFLGFMKKLQEGSGLDSELKDYLEELLTEIEKAEITDDEVRTTARELREWYVDDVDSLGNHVPQNDLSDYTSNDITY